MNLPVLPESPPEPLSSYSYSYPHKSSYRSLTPPVSLAELWATETREQLGLYAHIPFCEMRCGFCNLFTQSQPEDDIVTQYLAALARQSDTVRDCMGPSTFSQFAVGGGTPTYLSATQLAWLLQEIQDRWSFQIRNVPTSVETSPATATAEKMRVLAEFGVQRVSLGVQSWERTELQSIGRPQAPVAVHQALQAIRSAGIPILNIDLMYGGQDQSLQQWQRSLTTALSYQPEELYLYPLYVRPDTGLSRRGREPAAHRRDLYRRGRDLLRERGYQQSSLRCFRLPTDEATAAYACQSNGMIGLGCGARSYTTRLHYGNRFAVRQAGVKEIVGQWIRQPDAALALASHGVWLCDDEQRRRFLILGLLQADGFDITDYQARFTTTPAEDFPELAAVEDCGWLEQRGNCLKLTELGLEYSDQVGTWFYSPTVRANLEEFLRQ